MVMASLIKSPKLLVILHTCSEPRQFSELRRTVQITDRGLAKDLRELQRIGLLTKTKEGRYVQTEEGKRWSEVAEATSQLTRLTKIGADLDRKVLKALAKRDTATMLYKQYESFQKANRDLRRLGEEEANRIRDRLNDHIWKIQVVVRELKTGQDFPIKQLVPVSGGWMAREDEEDIESVVEELEDLRWPPLISKEADSLFQEGLELLKEIRDRIKVESQGLQKKIDLKDS